MTQRTPAAAACPPRRIGRYAAIATAILIALSAASPLDAQTDGSISVLRQRMMIFDESGLVGSGPDTTTLPATIGSSQHFVGNRSLDARGGRFAQVYHANPGGDNAVFFRSSRNGIDWTTPIQISDPRLANAHYGSVKYAGRGSATQKLVATYLSLDPVTKQDTLRGTFSTDNGVTWSASTVVGAHPDAVSIIPTLSSAGDTVLSVWTRATSGGSWNETFINRSRDAGKTWDTMLVAVNGSQFSFYSHVLAGAAGRAWIVTSDDQFGKMNIQLSRSSNAGAQWSRITNVNTESGLGQPFNMNFYPALESGGSNTIYAVWSDNREGQSNIYFSSSDNNGTNWSPHVRISGDDTLSPAANDGGQAGARRAGILLSGLGRLYVVWADDREGPSTVDAERNRDIYIVTSTDGGEVWGQPIRVNTATQVRGQESPSFAIHSAGTRDSVLIVWNDSRSSSTSVPADPLFDISASRDGLRIAPIVRGSVEISIAPSLVGSRIDVTLVDAQGRIIGSLFQGTAGRASLDVPVTTDGLASGLYFVHAVCGRSRATTRIVVTE